MKIIEEKIAVMQAFADGKEIEVRNSKSTGYYLCKEPLWDWSSSDYRIKTTPEYIPFTFEDAEFLIGKLVKSKNKNLVEKIIWCNSTSTSASNYKALLSDFTFIDGSPCGKLKTI